MDMSRSAAFSKANPTTRYTTSANPSSHQEPHILTGGQRLMGAYHWGAGRHDRGGRGRGLRQGLAVAQRKQALGDVGRLHRLVQHHDLRLVQPLIVQACSSAKRLRTSRQTWSKHGQ